ncbi:hypothetical protein BOTNAR_0153g00010 [Botryotinia narcissicola]|uniref:Glucose-methanol-choline oxidoreductase C-terminal domain-containing protein n=1 Tax=Botryotinia narcissicola TaxID=278944 RepID=A0A4Z1ITL0_9HELO|nr:hypothetical protein BOTNAR_0153g00010 [Botryotinia narcissicola]
MTHQESFDANESYDYIICGGGTSGCVIAARLADNSTASILIVEAGASNDTYPATAIPAAVSQILGTEADWNIKSEPCFLVEAAVVMGHWLFVGIDKITIIGALKGGVEMRCSNTCQSTGKSAHGCGHAVRSVSQGTRTMATDYITSPMKTSGVSIQTNTYIDRISLETDTAGALRANGVFLQDITGKKSFVKAHKEVVLSFYEVSKPALTNDHLIWHACGKDKSSAQYRTDKTGFFSQFPFGTFAFARLDSRLSDSHLWNSAPRTEGLYPMGLSPTQPHVEFWNTECYSPKYMLGTPPPQMASEVSLKSSDPTENPIVNHRYLEDPLDMLVFSEGCRMANEIATRGIGTKDIVIGSWPQSRNHHTFTTREEWVPIIRSNVDTCYHPAGTCMMGRLDDPLAVLDENFKVRGITNLRVADASVMPFLIGGHPQMPVYGIAEKAADLIISDK